MAFSLIERKGAKIIRTIFKYDSGIELRPMQQRSSIKGIVHIAGTMSASAYIMLAWWPSNIGPLPLWLFYSLLGMAVTSVVFVFWQSRNTQLSPQLVLLWAIIFRIIGLLGTPIYEDDYYRYLWDAYQFANQGTPYGIAPADFFTDDKIPLAFQGVLDGINYPDVKTIYAPSFQILFLLAYWIAPGEVWALQLLLCVADIGLIVLLLKLTTARWALLYAWSPLVIKEIAFTAHPDGFGALLLVAAVAAQQQRYWLGCVFFLALSIAAKIFALIAAPLILCRLPWRYRFYCCGFVFIFYLPFVIQGGSDIAGLVVLASEWQFNSSLYILLRQLLSPMPTKILLASVFLSFYCFYLYRHYRSTSDNIPRLDLVYGGFFLIAPVVNAWYLLWLLPFAVVYPSLWAWTFSLVVLLSYTTGLTGASEHLAAFQIPVWILTLEYGAVLIALLWDVFHKKSTFFKAKQIEPQCPK